MNFIFRQRRWRTIKAYEFHYAGQLQHSQTVTQHQVNKNVSGEEHQIQFLAPIFPSSFAVIERQKTFDLPLLQLPRDSFLMTRAGIRRIPEAFRRDQCQGRSVCVLTFRLPIQLRSPSHSYAPSLTTEDVS